LLFNLDGGFSSEVGSNRGIGTLSRTGGRCPYVFMEKTEEEEYIGPLGGVTASKKNSGGWGELEKGET